METTTGGATAAMATTAAADHSAMAFFFGPIGFQRMVHRVRRTRDPANEAEAADPAADPAVDPVDHVVAPFMPCCLVLWRLLVCPRRAATPPGPPQ